MPITGTLAMIAAASMAGLPLLNGFLSKEMMLEAAAAHRLSGLALAGARAGDPGRALLGRLLVPLRHGRVPGPAARRLPAPSARPAARHVAAGGGARGARGADRHRAVAGRARSSISPPGRSSAAPLPDYHLALWHGVTPALFMTAVALAGGLLLLAAYRPVGAVRQALPRPEAKSIFDQP